MPGMVRHSGGCGLAIPPATHPPARPTSLWLEFWLSGAAKISTRWIASSGSRGYSGINGIAPKLEPPMAGSPSKKQRLTQRIPTVQAGNPCRLSIRARNLLAAAAYHFGIYARKITCAIPMGGYRLRAAIRRLLQIHRPVYG